MMRYVVGFMFSEDRSAVALIRKCKPEWQHGKLNGIGGKIEPNEDAVQAMVREFKEETGADTEPGEWKHFAEAIGVNNGDEAEEFHCDFFASVGSLQRLRSAEYEQVELWQIGLMHLPSASSVENVAWLLRLALDHLADGRPGFVTAIYPSSPTAAARSRRVCR